MPRIAVPDGPEHITERVYALRPEYQAPAKAMLNACMNDSILPMRLRELARYRIAQINGCLLCQAARVAGADLVEDDYAEVATHATSMRFSVREALAIDFAERFALDHHSLDDEAFERLHAEFSDGEILDLTYFVGRFMAFGRMTHVLGLDDSCSLAGMPY